MLNQLNWKSASAALLLSVMLAGCGSGGNQAATANGTADAGGTTEAAQGTANTNGQASTGAAGQSAAQTPERTADLMGKIVSVSADAIVIQKSKVQPADMPQGGQGGRMGGGQAPADGTGGAPQGEPPADGAAPQGTDAAQGQAPAAGGDGQQRPAGGRGGFGQMMEFTEEQVTVKLSTETAFTAMSFGRGNNNADDSAQLTASDLKEGDIITVWLNPDQSTAQTVLLRRMPGNNGEAGSQQ